VAGFVGNFQFNVNCQLSTGISSRIVKGKFYYPFDGITLYASADEKNICANETDVAKQVNLDMNYKSEAQYFVFTGVVSMLFVLVALVYYVMFEDRAKEATSTDVGLFSFPVVVRVLLFLVVISCYFLLLVEYNCTCYNINTCELMDGNKSHFFVDNQQIVITIEDRLLCDASKEPGKWECWGLSLGGMVPSWIV